jgi:RNA polymerase sigma-70 factor, ECF subfamily
MKRFGSGFIRMMPMGGPIAQGKGEAAGFEELAMPVMDSAYNLARWLARNDHDAEDLVQETYLKAFRNFRSFQAGTNFRAWVYCILRNTFLNSRTGPRAIPCISLDSDEERPELAVETNTPESILMKRLDSQLVQRAIDDLPIHYREPLLLCDVEEMSYREIAEILSIPIGTVMSRLARARKLIRQFLRNTPATLQTTSSSQPIAGLEAGSQDQALGNPLVVGPEL